MEPSVPRKEKMKMLKQITRAEFCKKAHVSDHDPMISCVINGEYLMPAFGCAFYKDRDRYFRKYYVRNVDTKEVWRILIPRNDDGRAGIIHYWKHDDSERFGGHWEFWKIWR
jgi:hypothetical protein